MSKDDVRRVIFCEHPGHRTRAAQRPRASEASALGESDCHAESEEFFRESTLISQKEDVLKALDGSLKLRQRDQEGLDPAVQIPAGEMEDFHPALVTGTGEPEFPEANAW